MEKKNHLDENTIRRLSKIEGQIRGIKEMGVNGRSCSEILTQLSAVQSAIRQVSKIIMLDHLEHCIVEGIQEGNIDRAIQDINSVVDQFSKMK